MRQLNGQDATFLYIEKPGALMHISALYIYKQSTARAGKVRFKQILKHLEGRLGTSPIFRQKLVRVPMNLDHPYWIEDADFDLEFHVRHIALPKPGDWRQFCIQVSRLHSRSLDMARPLWEMYVIEGLDKVAGLPKGSFALLTKMHHAAVDGATGAELTGALHDLAADAPSVPVKDDWSPEKPPMAAELLARAAVNNTLNMAKLGTRLPALTPFLGDQILKSGVKSAKRLVGIRPEKEAPRTRFNEPVSPHRVFDACRLDLSGIKALRQLVPGATVNDVVLALCGGGLRAYLQSKRELPDENLWGVVPINTRNDAERDTGGNQIAFMGAELFTTVEDPVKRLACVHQSTQNSKEIVSAVGARELTDINRHAPAATLALAGRLLSSEARLGDRVKGRVNCAITNVPGPQVPLYLCGAQMVSMMGIGPVMNGLALFFTITSYAGELAVTFCSDRKLVPDPEVLTQCLHRSFDEMMAVLGPTEAPGGKKQKNHAANRKS